MTSRTNPSRVRRLARRAQGQVMKRVFSGPQAFERSLDVWPPLAGAGVKVRGIADDWSHGTVVLRLGPLNRNMHGAAFGGTLFAMTDILFGTLVMKRLGSDYEAWTRTGSFQYLNPGRNGAKLLVDADDAMIDDIISKVEQHGYYNVAYTSVIRNPDGTVVGIGQQDLHVRPRKGREAQRPTAQDGSTTARGVEESAPPLEPRGITLASLVTALAWRAWGSEDDASDRGGQLNSALSHSRRIPDPEDQARYVAAEALKTGALAREQILELHIPERLLPVRNEE
ncbi:MAG: PaaI family thioesterase [Corynebacterium sp.]|uniref:PaaI family thioesterase n=1 Tax=Corynebacterium sp. TaxID=1720 RepID=UPI003F905772